MNLTRSMLDGHWDEYSVRDFRWKFLDTEGLFTQSPTGELIPWPISKYVRLFMMMEASEVTL